MLMFLLLFLLFLVFLWRLKVAEVRWWSLTEEVRNLHRALLEKIARPLVQIDGLLLDSDHPRLLLYNHRRIGVQRPLFPLGNDKLLAGILLFLPLLPPKTSVMSAEMWVTVST